MGYRVQELEGDKVAMLSFFPKIECDVVTECIFVVDRSGSMEGDSINSGLYFMSIF